MSILSQWSYFNKELIGKKLYRLALLILMFSVLISKSMPSLGQALFLLFFLNLFFGTLYFHLHSWRYASGSGIAGQLALIGILMTLFWYGSLYAAHYMGTKCSYKIALAGAAALLYFSLYWVLIWLKGKLNSGRSATISASIAVMGLIIIFSLLYLPVLNGLFQGDSFVYYDYIRKYAGKWGFAIHKLEPYRCGYHLSYGYSLFAYTGYIMAGFRAVGIRLANLFIYLVTIYYVFRIAGHFWKKQNSDLPAIIAVMFVASPLVIGLCQEVSLDSIMTCFFIWMIGSWLDSQYCLTFFNSMLLCFTKENSAVLLAGFIFGLILYDIYKMAVLHQVIRLPLKTVLRDALIFFYPPVMLVLNFLLYNSSWGQIEDGPSKKMMGSLNSIQINPGYILFKLKELLILNFKWVVVLVIVWGTIAVLSRRRTLLFSRAGMAVLCSFIFFIVFQLFYFTYPNYRYYSPDAFFAVLFVGYTLVYCMQNRRVVTNVIASALSVLFFVQSFFQIDPLSNLSFKRVSAGNGDLISLSRYGASEKYASVLVDEDHGADLKNEKFRDYVQINREYTGFQLCVERLFRKIGIGSDTGIVVESAFEDPYWGNLAWTFANLFGTTSVKDVAWDPDMGKLTYKYESSVPVNWISEEDTDKISNYRSVWYLVFPFDGKGADLLKHYHVKAKLEENLGNWKVIAYKIR